MPSVIVAIMWKLFFQPQAGILNEALYRAHLPGSTIDWLSDFNWALPAVILVGVWAGMPQTTIALLAGIQSVSDDLHEAAAVDGATAWQRFRTVTLPQLKPVIIAITSLDLIWNFNSFGLVFVLTQGGPGHSTELPTLFAYNEAFKYGQFGYAAALGDAMVVVIAFILVFWLWGRLKETNAMIVSPRQRSTRIAQYAALGLYMLFLGFPLLWMLSVSLKGPQSSSSSTRAWSRSSRLRELHRRGGAQRAPARGLQQLQGREPHARSS